MSATAMHESPPRDTPVLEVVDLKKHYPITSGLMMRMVGNVFAVDGISLTIGHGETLGLVGESGCGKSTAGKTILRLTQPTQGNIMLNGQDIAQLGEGRLRPLRRQMQIIFQDPSSSLNPRLTAGDIVAEPLLVHGGRRGPELEETVAGLFDRVGLARSAMDKYPHEFSGGQRQRIGIARALALKPSLIICDEAVSALDVSIQAQVVNLLIELQRDLGLSYLFISHDLAVVEHISHRVAVMYLGRIVEMADTQDLYARPLHPYTEALLSAVPNPDPSADRKGRIILKGDIPTPINPPKGCHFHTRCPYAMPRCREEYPQLRELEPGHVAACHLHEDGVSLPLGKQREALA